MKKNSVKIIGICVVAALVILIVTLPVSGGKASRPHDGFGNQYSGQMVQNETSQGYQQAGNENISCIHEDYPNNGTPKRDGTGLKSGQYGNFSANGPKPGQGSGRQCR